jgi:hypothetical protein
MISLSCFGAVYALAQGEGEGVFISIVVLLVIGFIAFRRRPDRSYEELRDKAAQLERMRQEHGRTVPSDTNNAMLSPEEAAERIAATISPVFSSAHFMDLFQQYTLPENWSVGDALAVWCSLGNLVLVLVAWEIGKGQTKAFRIIDHGRSTLLTHWNLSGSTRDRHIDFVNKTEASAVATYIKCKTGDDLRLFFTRYVSCILGKPVEFSQQGFLEDLLKDVHYGDGDMILAATVCDIFVTAHNTSRELLTGALIDWNSPIPSSVPSN